SITCGSSASRRRRSSCPEPIARVGLVIRRGPLALLLLLATASCGPVIGAVVNRVHRVPLPVVSAEAAALHRSSVVVDLHADALLWGRDLAKRSRFGHEDLPRLREG